MSGAVYLCPILHLESAANFFTGNRWSSWNADLLVGMVVGAHPLSLFSATTSWVRCLHRVSNFYKNISVRPSLLPSSRACIGRNVALNSSTSTLCYPNRAVLGFWDLLYTFVSVLLKSIHQLTKKNWLELGNSGLLELLLLPPIYLALKRITAQWTEFYNIGEHIRDYAILSAVSRDPLFTKDPWLDSLNLYYYTYWYRFGYLVKKLFDFTTAETYHFLICFVLAYLFVLVLRLCRSAFKFNWKESLFVTSLTVLGSNILGLITTSKDGFWWGPSRAVSAGVARSLLVICPWGSSPALPFINLPTTISITSF